MANQAAATAPKRSPRQPAGTAPKKDVPSKQSEGQAQGAESPDEGGAGATSAGELRGGTKQVLIETVSIPGRGGRPQGPEPYPFGDLVTAKRLGDGTIEGQSFFIPEDDNPDAAMASARKRHKGVCKFWSRKTTVKIDGMVVKGVRIWKAPLDAE